MTASLADQLSGGEAATLAIALGANLPSHCGSPIATLISVRPLLEASLQQWGQGLSSRPTAFRWSPLFETEPVGGPPGQPPYINAVLLVEGLVKGLAPRSALGARAAAAEALLEQLQMLEQDFGRERQARWAPRSLDLDLLWWGDLNCDTPRLKLPHPLWRQRDFVLAPLAALAGLAPGPACTVVALAGRPGWPEQPIVLQHGLSAGLEL